MNGIPEMKFLGLRHFFELQLVQINKISIFKKHNVLQRFLMVERLGKGAFGSLDKVKRIQAGQYYAMKTANLKEEDKANALNEIRLFAPIDHPNVVKYREAFLDHSDGTGREGGFG